MTPVSRIYWGGGVTKGALRRCLEGAYRGKVLRRQKHPFECTLSKNLNFEMRKLLAGSYSTPPFLEIPPFSMKHPHDNFSLQNVNWHPSKCKLAPSKKGLAIPNLQLLRRIAKKSPLLHTYFGACQFALRRLQLSWGCFIERGENPQKGGTLAAAQLQLDERLLLKACGSKLPPPSAEKKQTHVI